MDGVKYIRKNKKTWKKFRGSITIEASFIMPMLFVVIIMLVFLMLFYYNKITVWKNTYYTGIKLAEAKREGTVYDLETEWSKISKDTLVLPENIQVSQKKVTDSIVVTGKVDFTIPFWGSVEIEEKSAVPLCSSRETIARNKLWKE
jgi:putative transposon-encoded protein